MSSPSELNTSFIQELKEELAQLEARLQNLIALLAELDSQIGESAKVPLETRGNSHPRPYARMLTDETGPRGLLITKQRFDDISANPSAFPIFIIDRGEYSLGNVGETYLNHAPVFRRPPRKSPQQREQPDGQKKEHLTPLEYRLLFFILRNKGRECARYLFNLIKHCWHEPVQAKQLYDLWKTDPDKFTEESAKYRKKISELSKFLHQKLGIKYQTMGTGKYDLTTWLSFCVLVVVNKDDISLR